MSKQEQAIETFKSGYNCAQSVLSAFCPELGLSPEQAMKVSSGFGGGMARQGETCGAVTGAMMAIGLAEGSPEASEAAKERVYARISEFLQEFRGQHGSTLCRDLLECNLGTEEGRKKAHETGLTRIRCPKFIATAVQTVDKILAPRM